MRRSDVLRDPAADVIACEHRSVQSELGNKSGNASGLRRRTVVRVGVAQVPVRFAETTQVGNDHPDGVAQQGNDVAVVV
jgi:hypothetical protein